MLLKNILVLKKQGVNLHN